MLENKDDKQLFGAIRRQVREAENSAGPMGWNEPSHRVWSNIVSDLRRRKFGSLLAFLPWVTSGLLALAIVFLINDRQSVAGELKSLQSTLLSAQDSIQTLKELCDQERSGQDPGETGTLGSQTGNEESKGTATFDRSLAMTGKTLAGSGSGKDTVGTTPRDMKWDPAGMKSSRVNPGGSYLTESPAGARDMEFGEADTSRSQLNPDHSIIHVQTLFPSGNSSGPLSSGTQEEYEFEISPLMDRAGKQQKPVSPFTLHVQGGAGTTQVSQSGFRFPVSEDLEITDDPGLAWRISVEGGVSLHSRLSVQTGLGYALLEPKTSYRVRLPYDPGMEVANANGNYHLDFEHSLPASLGNVDVNFGLLRNSSDIIAAGDTIPVAFEGIQKAAFLQIPLGVVYTPFRSGKFELTTGLGVQFNYLLNVTTDVLSFEVQHDALHNRYALISSSRGQYKQWTMDLAVSLGADYRLTNTLSASAGVSASLPMQPMYSDNGVESRIRTIWGNLGLRVHF